MFRLLILLGFLIIITSCSTPKKVSNRNLSSIYRKEAQLLNPKLVIFHLSDSVSQLHYSISANELLTINNSNNQSERKFRISYTLLINYETKEIAASDTIDLSSTESSGLEKNITGKLELKVKTGQNYVLVVELTDMNRNRSTTGILNVYKENSYTRQNFLLRDSTGAPVFRNFTTDNEKLILTSRNSSKKIFASYYKSNFPLALPPFVLNERSILNFKPDSSFQLIVDENHNAILPVFSKKGIYHFHLDSLNNEGFTLFKFDEFPEITSPEQLAQPLRYITSNEEYKTIESNPNKKAAADNFWLRATGSKERAREVIKTFYNRVQDANIYFTSYLEGWKTDRGIIFIIYGRPSMVFKTAYGESWIYNEDRNMGSLTFTFNKIDNIFSDNDFSLDRSPVFKRSWYLALDYWRQGHLYFTD